MVNQKSSIPSGVIGPFFCHGETLGIDKYAGFEWLDIPPGGLWTVCKYDTI